MFFISYCYIFLIILHRNIYNRVISFAIWKFGFCFSNSVLRSYGYVINEINCTVTAFTRDTNNGGLRELQTISALPPKVAMQQGFSGAELEVHPSGRYLYTSIRGHNSIALFSIDQNTGKLTYVENQPTQGNTPRGFGIDPQGRYLLVGNQNSDSVVVFRIDGQTGKLTPTGSKIDVGAPVCIRFVK